MKTLRIPRPIVIASLVALMVPIVLFAPKAYAESYVAGQIGLVKPQSLSDGKVTQDGIGGLSLSDQPLKDSLGLGGKFGHYFTKARWIGLETGLSYSTPHIKGGSLRFTGAGGSATLTGLSGVHQRMVTWDMDVIFRYPGYRLQPYFGIGPSFYFATLKGPAAPPGQSATSIGFNTELGVQYYLTRQWTLFGEWKYNYARMDYSSNHSNQDADPFGFKATYSASTFSVGIGYHF
ncbi:MAG: porin family protein [Nitrospira sp.]|nr:porin family protein [Nitrospira sp.]